MSRTTTAYGNTYDFFPDGHYIHPFYGLYYAYDCREDEAKEHPRTVRFPYVSPRPCALTRGPCQIAEMQMCDLSNHIREQPDWWEKIENPVLVEKWKRQVLNSQEDIIYRIRRLTERMVNASRFRWLT